MYTFKDLFIDEVGLFDYLNGSETSSGSFSTVYLLDLPALSVELCVKETTDPAYLEYIKFLNEFASYSQHYPKIYDITVIDGVTYLLMERLDRSVGGVLSEIVYGAEIQGYCDRDPSLFKGLCPSFDLALDEMEEWFNSNSIKIDSFWDLRDENIMVRHSDGAYVITDPWAMDY